MPKLRGRFVVNGASNPWILLRRLRRGGAVGTLVRNEDIVGFLLHSLFHN